MFNRFSAAITRLMFEFVNIVVMDLWLLFDGFDIIGLSWFEVCVRIKYFK